MNKAEAKVAILGLLTRHVGSEKAVGMGELWIEVFREPWGHRINDTRLLRKYITELRYDGYLIGEIRTKNGGGYYLARSGHELGTWKERRKREALKKLYMIAKMERISLDELLGQMRLNLSVTDARGQRKDNGLITAGE